MGLTSSDETGIGETTIIMKIGDTKVNVNWEDNQAVAALRDMAREGDVTIQMSMYGGFEQAGSLGQNLPRDDKQTTTTSGDIILYSGKWVFIAAPLLGSALAAFCYLGLAGKEKDKMADPNETAI